MKELFFQIFFKVLYLACFAVALNVAYNLYQGNTDYEYALMLIVSFESTVIVRLFEMIILEGLWNEELF